jgi:hypothetical protein
MNRIHFVVIAFVALMFAYGFYAFAGPLFPMIRASSSSNGKFLVIVEYQFENPDETIKRISKITYHVDHIEEFINDKFTPPAAYWSDSWNVTLAWPKEASGGLLPCISDDGMVLVFISVTPPMSETIEVLRIYRKDENHGTMLKAYQLKDIWTQEEIKAHIIPLVIDGRPLWFAGGSFSFSSDNRQFIYKTPWGKTVSINLMDGSASRK